MHFRLFCHNMFELKEKLLLHYWGNLRYKLIIHHIK